MLGSMNNNMKRSFCQSKDEEQAEQQQSQSTARKRSTRSHIRQISHADRIRRRLMIERHLNKYLDQRKDLAHLRQPRWNVHAAEDDSSNLLRIRSVSPNAKIGLKIMKRRKRRHYSAPPETRKQKKKSQNGIPIFVSLDTYKKLLKERNLQFNPSDEDEPPKLEISETKSSSILKKFNTKVNVSPQNSKILRQPRKKKARGDDQMTPLNVSESQNVCRENILAGNRNDDPQRSLPIKSRMRKFETNEQHQATAVRTKKGEKNELVQLVPEASRTIQNNKKSGNGHLLETDNKTLHRYVTAESKLYNIETNEEENHEPRLCFKEFKNPEQAQLCEEASRTNQSISQCRKRQQAKKSKNIPQRPLTTEYKSLKDESNEPVDFESILCLQGLRNYEREQSSAEASRTSQVTSQCRKRKRTDKGKNIPHKSLATESNSLENESNEPVDFESILCLQDFRNRECDQSSAEASRTNQITSQYRKRKRTEKGKNTPHKSLIAEPSSLEDESNEPVDFESMLCLQDLQNRELELSSGEASRTSQVTSQCRKRKRTEKGKNTPHRSLTTESNSLEDESNEPVDFESILCLKDLRNYEREQSPAEVSRTSQTARQCRKQKTAEKSKNTPHRSLTNESKPLKDKSIESLKRESIVCLQEHQNPDQEQKVPAEVSRTSLIPKQCRKRQLVEKAKNNPTKSLTGKSKLHDNESTEPENPETTVYNNESQERKLVQLSEEASGTSQSTKQCRKRKLVEKANNSPHRSLTAKSKLHNNESEEPDDPKSMICFNECQNRKLVQLSEEASGTSQSTNQCRKRKLMEKGNKNQLKHLTAKSKLHDSESEKPEDHKSTLYFNGCQERDLMQLYEGASRRSQSTKQCRKRKLMEKANNCPHRSLTAKSKLHDNDSKELRNSESTMYINESQEPELVQLSEEASRRSQSTKQCRKSQIVEKGNKNPHKSLTTKSKLHDIESDEPESPEKLVQLSKEASRRSQSTEQCRKRKLVGKSNKNPDKHLTAKSKLHDNEPIETENPETTAHLKNCQNPDPELSKETSRTNQGTIKSRKRKLKEEGNNTPQRSLTKKTKQQKRESAKLSEASKSAKKRKGRSAAEKKTPNKRTKIKETPRPRKASSAKNNGKSKSKSPNQKRKSACDKKRKSAKAGKENVNNRKLQRHATQSNGSVANAGREVATTTSASYPAWLQRSQNQNSARLPGGRALAMYHPEGQNYPDLEQTFGLSFAYSFQQLQGIEVKCASEGGTTTQSVCYVSNVREQMQWQMQ